jgi:hypothetical protein
VGQELLLWSKDAREPHKRMKKMNDYYVRDASSYASFLRWPGSYDRPFPGRPVFGTVRSMTSAPPAMNCAWNRGFRAMVRRTFDVVPDGPRA